MVNVWLIYGKSMVNVQCLRMDTILILGVDLGDFYWGQLGSKLGYVGLNKNKVRPLVDLEAKLI
jgi:hypothetical protein